MMETLRCQCKKEYFGVFPSVMIQCSLGLGHTGKHKWLTVAHEWDDEGVGTKQ